MAYIKLEDALKLLDKNSITKKITLADGVSIYDSIKKLPIADVVEVVRCEKCKHSQELDKHCEINRSAYRHCNMWRGEEEKNVWHSYKKYRKDYSIVEFDGFCDMGERRDT